MEERKPISKKLRFEVFKRDKFTCQYCGRMAPDVVLEVDHIKPVSKGGKNELINLVTSCFECNRGKSNKELSDNSTIKVQQRQLLEIAERKEQLEMLLEWRDSLDELQNDYVNAIEKEFTKKTGFYFTESGKAKVEKWLKQFSLQEILDALDIAVSTYFNGTQESSGVAFDKISGICFNRKKQKDDPRYYYSNYLKKACKSKLYYYNLDKIEAFVFRNILNENDFLKAKGCISEARNWTSFCEDLEAIFGDRP